MKEKILNKLDEILLLSLQKINRLHLSIINRYNLTKSTYQFLTANDKAENIDEYTKALNEALEDNKVKNIAISGSYGSGKSSFIKTFEKNNAKYNFLDISLATFKNKNIKETDNKPDLSLIEKSILEQMFYKVKNKTIPQSRLNKIDRLKLMPFKIVTILIVTLSYFIVFSPKSLETITFFKDLIQINTTEYLKYLPIIILFLGAYYLLKKLLIVLSNTNIEKLNLQNLELVSNNDSGSLLNKYLDEILYFFEKTNFDVVVFQDLDRYDNLDIFTKLRELNNFINNSEQVNKKIVFIYAVKDEMFTNADERTKFFDFLIPIIPYINATNSKDILLDYFKGVNQNFLYDISLYISDMRLLKNIYNEYLIYSNNLDEKLDKTKLLAMIIYKNFEPQDFELLHKCKGLVYDVFNSKKEHIKSYITDIENDIDEIKDKINEIANEPREDIKELRQLYILKIIKNLNNQFDGNLYLSGKSINIQDSVEDDSFELIKESNNIISRYFINGRHGVHNSQPVIFENIEQEIGKYDGREQLIVNKINNKKSDLLNEIETFKDSQEKLNNITIKELLESFSDNTILGDKSFENKELLKYLLSYGHIDETYEEYISNFFGVSITKDEQDFLRNVKNNGKALSFNYELKNLQEIVKYRLTENEFHKESVLNFNLVDYILENQDTYPKQVKVLFQQLPNESEVSKEFILYCLDTSNQRIKFVKLIVKYYKNFWLFLVDKKSDKLNTYFGWVVHYTNYEDIIKLNENNSLKNYLTNISYMQKFSGDEAKKVIKIIESFDIKFSRLDSLDSTGLLDFIFIKSHYELNPQMVNKMIFNKCAPKSEIEEYLKNAHLTTIKSDKLMKDGDVLIEYINDNINEYIKNVFLEIDTNTKESEEVVIELLNNDDIEENLKVKIIEKQEVKISNINNVDETLWEYLFKNNKVVSVWSNTFKYYNNNDTDNTILIDYLNIKENAENVSKIKCGKEYSEENEFFTQGLLKLIIKTNDFTVESYEYLIKNTGWSYNDLDISNVDEDKILLLIKYNRFQFEKVCFDTLKENTDTLHISLIEKNKNSLLEEFEKFEFETDDIIKILQLDRNILSDSIKKDLIEKIDYDLITNANIAKLIYKYVDKTIIKSIYYTKKMLLSLESLESKINLVVEQKSEFNDEELIEILQLLPNEYNKIANLDGKQTTLNENNYNKELIKVLKDREFITKDKVEKRNKIRLYIKNKVE